MAATPRHTHPTQVGLFDIRTGEAYDLMVVPVRRQDRRRGRFVVTFQDALAEIAGSSALTDGDRTVLLMLMSRLDWDNYLMLNVSELAEEMGRDRSGVSHSVKRLRDMGILARGPRVGNTYTYRFNPETAWKGTEDNRRALKAQQDRAAQAGWGVIEGNADRWGQE